MKRYSILFAVSLLSLVVFQCGAQGTAFTYQGRLNSGGNNPANGNYDLRFAIWNAESGPSQVGGTVGTNALAVSNGLFTVTLDFGAGIFTGADRWLEITVRTNGGGSFTTLIPRQKLTATPYAVTAGNVASGGLLAGIYGNALTFSNSANSFAGTFSGNGAALSNVNALTLGGIGSNGFWRTVGNAGTTPGVNFLGTTDNQPLAVKVNGATALRIDPTATAPNIIGGLSGTLPTVVGANVRGAVVAGGNAPAGPVTGLGGGDFHAVYDSDGAIGGGFGNKVGTDNGDPDDAPFATVAGGVFNGAVSYAATVAGGDGNLAGGLRSSVGGGGGNRATGPYSTISGGANNEASGYGSFAAGNQAKANHSGSFVWADGQLADFASTANDQFLIRASGGVGIGTRTPVKALDVRDGTGALGDGGAIHVGGIGVNGDAKLINFGDGDFVHIGENGSDDILELKATRFFFTPGKVGIGTSTPDRSLDVNGPIGLFDSGTRDFYAGLATEVGAQLLNFGINDGPFNRFGGFYTSANQGGFLRTDTRPGQPLFGFFGRPAGVATDVNQLGFITSDGSVRFEVGVGQKFSLGGNGNFEIDAPGIVGGRFIVTDGGNVGIGTPSPSKKLDVRDGPAAETGGIHVGGTGINGQPKLIYFGDGSFVTMGENGVDDQMQLTAASFVFTNRTGNGRVGIGRVAAVNKLEVEGEASKATAGSWLANSDRRIKTEVETITNALQKLEQVRLASFRYTQDYRGEHPGIEDRKYVNVIAQEFQKVFPDAVKSSGDKLPNGDEILQVDTYPLTIYSAAAVQELNRKVAEGEATLREQLKRRDAENAELRRDVADLKKLVQQIVQQRAEKSRK
jgi:hypothetical protein